MQSDLLQRFHIFPEWNDDDGPKAVAGALFCKIVKL